VTPLYPQKLALTSPTGGGRSVGMVRSRTKATEFSLVTLVGFIIRTYHDARSPESQISVRIFIDYRIPLFPNTLTFPESTMLHQDNVTVGLSEKHVPQIYLQVQNTLFVLINRNKIFSFYSSLSSNSILSYDVSICRLCTIRFLISVTK